MPNTLRLLPELCTLTATIGLALGGSAAAQDTRTFSYHIGNSRTYDYLAFGEISPRLSALQDIAKLAGREDHIAGFHINWGQPLNNILLNPPADLTIGGLFWPRRWDLFLGWQFEIEQLVVQPFWQQTTLVGADGVTVFEPATLASDVNAIEHWLSLIPAEHNTSLYIAGISPTLASGTFRANGELADPNADWLQNSQWDAPFDPLVDDRVVTTAAYYDALYHEVRQITNRNVRVIPSGRVFKALYDRGFNVLDLYEDDLHINIAGELVESLTVASVMFELDPLTINYTDLPLQRYNHPLVDEEFFLYVRSVVRDVLNDYEYDFVSFIPEPSSATLGFTLLITLAPTTHRRARLRG